MFVEEQDKYLRRDNEFKKLEKDFAKQKHVSKKLQL